MRIVATWAGLPIENRLSFSHRLTHLHFASMSLAWLLRVLCDGPQLEYLRVGRVHSVRAGDGAAKHLNSVVHGRLETLCIDRPSDKHLLSFLTLPALKILELTPHQAQITYPASWPGSPAEIAFFNTCSLERLVLRHGPLNSRLTQIIEKQAKLVELNLGLYREYSDGMAKAPVLPNNVIAFLHAPRLADLRSISFVVVPQQLPAVREMLLSRKEAETMGQVTSLLSLGVTIWDKAHISEAGSDVHRDYKMDLKKHREYLDGVFKEFEDGGAEVSLSLEY